MLLMKTKVRSILQLVVSSLQQFVSQMYQPSLYIRFITPHRMQQREPRDGCRSRMLVTGSAACCVELAPHPVA